MKKLKKTVEFLEERMKNMQTRLSKNTVSEEARAAAEETIKNLADAIMSIQEAIIAADEAEEDNTGHLQIRIDEILAEIESLRKKIDDVPAEPVENAAGRFKKIANSAAYAYDFLQMVKNSANAAEFRENLKGLAVKNNAAPAGIYPDDAFLPGSMVKAITDGFAGQHRLLELVDWTGLPMFRALYETGNQVGAVHTKGSKKTEQTLTFSPIDIRPDIIYKYLTVDKVMLKQCETPEQANVLLEYITKELLTRVLFTVEQGILNGTAPFLKATTVNVQTNGVLQQIQVGLKAMDNFTNPVLICTKDAYFEILAATETQFYSGSVFGDDYLAKAFRVREIIPVDVTSTTSSSIGIWLMQPEDYKLVGDLRPDQYNSFNLEYNKEQYLTEIYIGGGSINPKNFIELTNAQ